MPEKRPEIVERPDPTQVLPDIYENWLSKQRNDAEVRAKAGYISQDDEGELERKEDAHEKAKRRKHGRTGR